MNASIAACSRVVRTALGVGGGGRRRRGGNWGLGNMILGDGGGKRAELLNLDPQLLTFL